LGTYVPVFIAPCALMPPFNRFHTDDLSKWTGAANDPSWIKLVDRLARLIGREGVAAAVRALATEDGAGHYEFARRYPDEPVARKIWAEAAARLRQEFENRMAAASAAAAAKVDADRAAVEARLAAAAPAFEAWLADERRAAAKGPKPDPLGLVEPAGRGEDQRLRDEITRLSSALVRAMAREGEWDAARGEIERLHGELKTARPASNATAARAHARVWVLSAGVGVMAAVLTGFVWQNAFGPPRDEARRLQTLVDSLRKSAADAQDRAAKL
jgi:hypothetical protein